MTFLRSFKSALGFYLHADWNDGLFGPIESLRLAWNLTMREHGGRFMWR